MQVSAKMDYALRALVELGLHWPDTNPCQLSTISRRAGVPQKFLIHILITLKTFDYVHSIRGKSGGYILAMDPREINLADIVKHLGGLGSFDEEKRKRKNDTISLLWQDIGNNIIQKLKTINLEELCNRQRQHIKTVSYEI